MGPRKSGTFLTNLYPLGKKSRDSWPDHYRELRFSSAAECRAYVADGRFKMLRELRERYQPKLIVCHGAAEWSAFEECFAQPTVRWHEEQLANGKPTRWQPGLVLTQFFGIRPVLFRRYDDVPALSSIGKKAMMP